jgi:hypothetical protein
MTTGTSGISGLTGGNLPDPPTGHPEPDWTGNGWDGTLDASPATEREWTVCPSCFSDITTDELACDVCGYWLEEHRL